MAGCEADPRTQMRGRREPGHVTDLGDQHRRADRTDAVDGLDRLIAAMVLEMQVDVALERRDLTVVNDDQLPQRTDPPSERRAKFELIELTCPGGPEDVGDGGQYALFGHHRM